jgi:methylthioribose-1-phosphate isomerase
MRSLIKGMEACGVPLFAKADNKDAIYGLWRKKRMKVDGRDVRPIWFDESSQTVKVIDQRQLPHEFVAADLTTLDEVVAAIQEMVVRGAPLIGATGAWGVYVIAGNSPGEAPDDAYLARECATLKAARPTAVNLAWAVERVMAKLLAAPPGERVAAARREAAAITEEEAENCRLIGVHGFPLIKNIAERKNGASVNILTHCNAGWLACVEYGTATAPMYAAFDAGFPSTSGSTKPARSTRGPRLTAWELGKHGIPHTVITDNAGGHLMQHGMVDMVIVGTDRTTYTGDVANKIGTYLKALAARDNNIPFYVALPSSTFDWRCGTASRKSPSNFGTPTRCAAFRDWPTTAFPRSWSPLKTARPQRRLRRHPGPPGYRLYHRAGRLRCQRERNIFIVSGKRDRRVKTIWQHPKRMPCQTRMGRG